MNRLDRLTVLSKLLCAFALVIGLGMIVGGAYGHSRLREWVLGGVTRDLLLRPARAALISH